MQCTLVLMLRVPLLRVFIGPHLTYSSFRFRRSFGTHLFFIIIIIIRLWFRDVR